MANIRKGTKIGPFTIVEEMPGAKGGMSSVYHATGSEQQGDLALKISRMDISDPRFNNALKQEVDILKVLNHPGVVRVFPVQLAGAKQEVHMARALELRGQPWYYVMEFLRGGSLRELNTRLGILPFALACSISTRLVDSLCYLHAHGIAHLDVKPENILFRYGSVRGMSIEPVLIDFGVAARTKNPRTTGGSLHTMAPEQLRQTRGELPPESPIDVTKMDIYSLGVVTYRMWTGDYPFGGVTAQSITNAVLNMAVQPPSTVNPALPREADQLMLRWLAKDPAMRPSLDEIKHYVYFWSDGIHQFSDLPSKNGNKKWWQFWKR